MNTDTQAHTPLMSNFQQSDWQLILVYFQTIVMHDVEYMNTEIADLPLQYATCPFHVISLTFSEHLVLVVTFP